MLHDGADLHLQAIKVKGGADLYLHPMEVKGGADTQLQPMEVNGGAGICLQLIKDRRWMFKGGCCSVGKPMLEQDPCRICGKRSPA